MKYGFFFPLALALLLTGCDLLGPLTSARRVSLTVDQDVYAPGDTLTLRLKNNSRHFIAYNLCSALLEGRHRGEGWQPVAGENDHVCKRNLAILKPGKTATAYRPLGRNLSAGTYRFRDTFFEKGDDPVEVITRNPFTVQG